MYGLFNIDDSSKNIKIFSTPGTFAWEKPTNASMMHIHMLGAGGGGGSGAKGAASAAGGGGSGSGGAYGSLIFPLWCLPDVLYINSGAGGIGGASSTIASNGSAGLSGTRAVISLSPNTSILAFHLMTCTAGNGGGGGTTVPAGGAGGAIATISGVRGSAVESSWFPTLGFGTVYCRQYTTLADRGQWSVASRVGIAGGVTGAGNPTPATVTNGVYNGPGAGGAGISAAAFAGGAVSYYTFDGRFISSSNGGTTTTTVRNAGPGGKVYISFPYYYGGGGGASSVTAAVNGGDGGTGGNGCGGGGGGAALTTAGNSGAGGNGGNGLIIIATW